jgi:hypothetical protein
MGIASLDMRISDVKFLVRCLPKCWPRERLKPVAEYAPDLFLVVSAEMLALWPFRVILRDYTLVTLGP